MDKKSYIQMGIIKDKPLKVTSSGVIVEDMKTNKTGYILCKVKSLSTKTTNYT